MAKAATKKSGDYWLGFDLGGTKMLAAVYDPTFALAGRKRRRTKAETGEKAGLERLIATIADAMDDAGIGPDRLGGIGIACPGPLDLDRGVILETPNLGWRNLNVKKAVEKAFGRPVVIHNDVDAGVYGEYRFGAGRGARCVLGIFPGTGIGGGCVYEGRIMRGRLGSIMEIGHVPAVADGPLCGCGRTGCLEAVAGRLAIAAECAKAVARGEAPNLAAETGTDLALIRSGAIARAIAAGDRPVEEIVRRAARLIGRVGAGAVNLLVPDVLILGGGLVEEMPALFQDEVERAARARVMPSFADRFEVKVAELGDDAGARGIAAWAQTLIADG